MKRLRQRLGLPYGGGWLPLKITAEAVAEKWSTEIFIKDKFGYLNIYWRTGNKPSPPSVLWNIGQAIELASGHTCQYCGSKKNVGQTSGGWIYTLCEKCRGIEQTPESPDQDVKVLAAIERLKSCLAYHHIPFEEATAYRVSESFERSQSIMH